MSDPNKPFVTLTALDRSVLTLIWLMCAVAAFVCGLTLGYHSNLTIALEGASAGWASVHAFLWWKARVTREPIKPTA